MVSVEEDDIKARGGRTRQWVDCAELAGHTAGVCLLYLAWLACAALAQGELNLI